MAKSYKVADAELFVFSEEVNTNPSNNERYYDAICKCNGNTIVVGKNIKNEYKNVIEDIINGIEENNKQYRAEVLKTNKNILVLIGEEAGGKSFYTIYYDYKDKLLTLYNLFGWMNANNDFAVDDMRFTEVRNGHQTALFEVEA